MFDETDYRKLVGGNESSHGKCPNSDCGISFDGEDIPERIRESYSKPWKWGKCIGIEIQGEYDGVSYWQCPVCKFTWSRWTGHRYVNNEIQGKFKLVRGLLTSPKSETNQSPTILQSQESTDQSASLPETHLESRP